MLLQKRAPGGRVNSPLQKDGIASVRRQHSRVTHFGLEETLKAGKNAPARKLRTVQEEEPYTADCERNKTAEINWDNLASVQTSTIVFTERRNDQRPKRTALRREQTETQRIP